MNAEVKGKLDALFEKLIPALKAKDIIKLREISNDSIKHASVYQDPDSISIAVVVYSIMKILERGNFDPKGLIVLLDHSHRHLEKEKDDSYKAEVQKILKSIAKIDKNLGLFINEVISQAKIKKGSGLYEHGISVGQAASLLGISQWQLQSYVGKTAASEEYSSKISIKKRLEIARGLFL